MRSWDLKRGSVLVLLATFVASACSGGFGGASASPSASTAASAEPSASASAAAEPVTLTYLVDDTDATQARANALADAYTAKHPNVTFEIETRPGGTEGDNIVKTRLSTGEMTDIFWYNSGSLLQALNPTESLVDLAARAVHRQHRRVLSAHRVAGRRDLRRPERDGHGRRDPVQQEGLCRQRPAGPQVVGRVRRQQRQAQGGRRRADRGDVRATRGRRSCSSWPTIYNVQSAVPDFAEQYTANKAHYSDTPAALAGFKRLQEGFEKGWYQKDFGAAKLDDGLNALAEGTIAQYPMLTFTLGTINENHPEAIQDIGFFGQPGEDAAKNGATIWMPAATYIAKSSENQDVAKDFLGFIASVEGTEVLTEAIAPSGPYVINGSKLPDDALPAVKDIQTYLESNTAGPALEFLSPVKGPSLEQITVAVGSGLNTAEEGAKLYDQDVEKQAKQLGLPGW